MHLHTIFLQNLTTRGCLIDLTLLNIAAVCHLDFGAASATEFLLPICEIWCCATSKVFFTFISYMLLPFKMRETEKRLGSKIEAKFPTF